MNKSVYDAHKDADDLLKPLKKWASIGFLRGFSFTRREVVPEGFMALPSTVFLKVATESLKESQVDKDERASREKYVQEVEEILRERQNKLVDAHFKSSVIGRVLDILLGLAFVLLMVTLFLSVGPFSKFTISFMVGMSLILMLLQLSVGRFIKVAEAAFFMEKTSVKLPWSK